MEIKTFWLHPAHKVKCLFILKCARQFIFTACLDLLMAAYMVRRLKIQMNLP